jgi:hypothetical protein
MKIADLERGLREISVDMRWNAIRRGNGVESLGDPGEDYKAAMLVLVGEAIKDAPAYQPARDGFASHHAFTYTDDDGRTYRVRVHVDLDPVP